MNSYHTLCICVQIWPPVCGVCPNYDVAVFQTWTVIPLHMGFVTIATPKIALHTHTFLPLYISFFCILFPTAPPSIAIKH